VCGACLLLAASAQGQNLFVAEVFGNIGKVTPPGGIHSTFATGVNPSEGSAFNSAGNLFVAVGTAATSTNITPGGAPQRLSLRVLGPLVLAFNSAGKSVRGG